MFPVLIHALQKAVLPDEVGCLYLTIIKDHRGETVPFNTLSYEFSKLVHFNEAHILLPTFPAGQIEKSKAHEPGSLCTLLMIPWVMVLTENMHTKLHQIWLVIPSISRTIFCIADFYVTQ